MRLANLEGYLKFPGPFPVASIRLNYVARPKAAERFVPRNDEGVQAAAEAPGAAPAGDRDVTILVPPDRADGGEASSEPEDMPDSGPVQRELELVPLPGEAGSPAEKAGAAEAPAPDDEPEPQTPPGEAPSTRHEDAADPNEGRASDWA